jgi:hypothetical protein
MQAYAIPSLNFAAGKAALRPQVLACRRWYVECIFDLSMNSMMTFTYRSRTSFVTASIHWQRVTLCQHCVLVNRDRRIWSSISMFMRFRVDLVHDHCSLSDWISRIKDLTPKGLAVSAKTMIAQLDDSDKQDSSPRIGLIAYRLHGSQKI